MTAALAAICALFGLCVGSFLNVVIHRVPERESVVRPRSHCRSCGAQIADRDNVPVVSWVLLRGRCRSCHARIPARYPLVELGTAVLFTAAALRFGATWELPAFCI
ncbi:MAG TPA: prepilin peptidase, partial [Acidimicrobiales bacterium]|nr:prepilin peptidase [Acidimicrobiales bacterium]